MNAGALVLREVSDGTWRDFALNVQDRAQKPPTRHSQPALLGCWRRALSLGASFEGPPAEEHLLRGDALKAHTERTEVVRHLAAADLERTAADVSRREYVLLLADPAGVVVSSSGGGQFSDEARRVRLIPGASWSELARGTNAIGTAIVERRPVYVRGSAHLAQRFHGLVCYAAPIFDADGSLAAVLDATSAFACADDAVGAAVVRTAGAITRALRDRAFAQAGVAIRRTLLRALDRMAGIALLIEPPGQVTSMNAGARLLFRPQGAPTASQLLGVDMTALLSEAQAPRGLSLERDGLRYDLRVEPIQTFDGRQIALLVFLEPVAASARPNRWQVATQPQDSAMQDSAAQATGRHTGARREALPSAASAAFVPIFSRDAELDQALALARRLADTTLPVLLLAETGAGKELVARALHDASRRARQPFVAINCAAIAPSLLESELFGYGSAAFTGAERGGRHGLFAAASGGSIFLDEAAEMPLPMQAALLRVLEDGSYRRVGETTAQRVDVRVVSATCKDLLPMVVAGTFRRDLFYRLKGAEIRLPPLRARQDRSALAAHLLLELARKRGVEPAPRLSPKVLACFEAYTWPGNVRELQSVLDVSLILAAGQPEIELDHLPLEFQQATPQRFGEAAANAASEGLEPDLDTLEASAVGRVLAQVHGNVSLAAKRLGVARSTLYRMMRRHQL